MHWYKAEPLLKGIAVAYTKNRIRLIPCVLMQFIENIDGKKLRSEDKLF
jgi:hypothetical protein